MRSNAGFSARRLSLTPLIDVIFLLLLFFMLSSTFSRFSEIPLQNAPQGLAAPYDVETILIRADRDTLAVNGRDIVTETLADRIQALRPDRAEAQAVALISVGPDLTAQGLVDVLAALRGLAWLQVRVLE